ncbi:MAG: hypothetical protein V3R84_07695 [Acidimicrobiia bacterium]
MAKKKAKKGGILKGLFKGKKLLDLSQIGVLAKRAVIEAANLEGNGEEKSAQARKLLAIWLDEAVVLPGLLELVDGPLISLIIETTYRGLKGRRGV